MRLRAQLVAKLVFRAAHLLGMAVFVVWAVAGPTIIKHVGTHVSVNYENLFAGVMNWAAIQAGFVFAAYASVRSNETRFALALKRNGTIQRFCNRLFELTLMCLLLAACSLIAGTFEIDAKIWPRNILFAAWLGLTVYALIDFIECIMTFWAIESD
jgi:uncharacterized membrane protein YqjE